MRFESIAVFYCCSKRTNGLTDLDLYNAHLCSSIAQSVEPGLLIQGPWFQAQVEGKIKQKPSHSVWLFAVRAPVVESPEFFAAINPWSDSQGILTICGWRQYGPSNPIRSHIYRTEREIVR